MKTSSDIFFREETWVDGDGVVDFPVLLLYVVDPQSGFWYKLFEYRCAHKQQLFNALVTSYGFSQHAAVHVGVPSWFVDAIDPALVRVVYDV
jgi:hypothetical protein